MFKHLSRIVVFLLVPCLIADPSLAAGYRQGLLSIKEPYRTNSQFDEQALAEAALSALRSIFEMRTGFSFGSLLRNINIPKMSITDPGPWDATRFAMLGVTIVVEGRTLVWPHVAFAAGFGDALANSFPNSLWAVLAFVSSVVAGVQFHFALRHTYNRMLYFQIHTDNVMDSSSARDTVQKAVMGHLTKKDRKLFLASAKDLMQSEDGLEKLLNRELTIQEQAYWQALRRMYGIFGTRTLSSRAGLLGMGFLLIAYVATNNAIQSPMANTVLWVTVGLMATLGFMQKPVNRFWLLPKWIRWMQAIIVALVIIRLWVISFNPSLAHLTQMMMQSPTTILGAMFFPVFGRLRGLTRPQFLETLLAAVFGSRAFAQRIDIEHDVPLPFSDHVVPYDNLPSQAKAIIQTVRDDVTAFHTANYVIQNGQARPNKTQDLHNDVANIFFVGLTPKLIQHMRALRLLTNDQIKSLEEAKKNNAGHHLLFKIILPSYFAQFGYYFYDNSEIVNGFLHPIVDFYPVSPAQIIQRRLGLPTHPMMTARMYKLGLGLFARDYPEFPKVSSTDFQGLPGTDQVIDWGTLKNKVHQNAHSLIVLLDRHPNLRKKGFLSPRQEPNLLQRFRSNLYIAFLRGVFGENLEHLTETQVTERLESFYLSEILGHELSHLYMYIHQKDMSVSDENPNFASWDESMAYLSANIDQPWLQRAFAGLVASSFQVNMDTLNQMPHGRDFLYVRNRISYWYWRQHRTDFPALNASAPDDQFQLLPHDIREAVWEKLPGISIEELNNLHKEVQGELNQPQNPLIRGMEVPHIFDDPMNEFDSFWAIYHSILITGSVMMAALITYLVHRRIRIARGLASSA